MAPPREPSTPPGARFGRLTVVAYHNSDRVDVVCECGNERTVEAGSLRRGDTKSCGCLRREAAAERARARRTHGASGTAEYAAWANIRLRILNPEHPAYADYGGRGLTMEPDWVESFEAFFEHVGPRPSPELSIDRIDNDRGYLRGNLRWATRSQQARNTRRAT